MLGRVSLIFKQYEVVVIDNDPVRYFGCICNDIGRIRYLLKNAWCFRVMRYPMENPPLSSRYVSSGALPRPVVDPS
jgi:hypothetical protein